MLDYVVAFYNGGKIINYPTPQYYNGKVIAYKLVESQTGQTAIDKALRQHLKTHRSPMIDHIKVRPLNEVIDWSDKDWNALVFPLPQKH